MSDFFGTSVQSVSVAAESKTPVKQPNPVATVPIADKLGHASESKPVAKREPEPELSRTPSQKISSLKVESLLAEISSPSTSTKTSSNNAKSSSTQLPKSIDGLKFVITGVLDGCSREEVEEKILTHGGKVRE